MNRYRNSQNKEFTLLHTNIWRPAVYDKQDIFEQNNTNIQSLTNNASFGTFVVQIGQTKK